MLEDPTPIIKLVLLISPTVTTPTSALTPTLNPIIKLVLLISPIVTTPTSTLAPTIPIVSTLTLVELTLLPISKIATLLLVTYILIEP